MSKNSPLNFGSSFVGQNPFMPMPTQNNALNNAMMFTGGQNLGLQAMMDYQQMQAGQNASAQAQNAASSSYQDPNNTSSVGFNNAPSEMDMPTANNFGTVPVTTGSLTPQTQNIARGMFGTADNRQRSVNRKPLINL
jgi:hypothetical protein